MAPSNISKDERTAIKQLQKEDSIMVLGADKGRATVVMDNLDLTLHVLREILSEDKDLKNRTLTLLNINDIIELSQFCLATVVYFSYSGDIYRRFCMAMGSPLSPFACNIFMEWLEQRAISTPHVACRPRLWKRYVDDVLEIARKGEVENLTEHLNSTDPTNSVKFTYEQEQEGSIPFLDTLITRKPDGSVKLPKENAH
ncbi:uncharacterized protein [Amphiura filiformis]|uniref:uncharacterized protein n=1 Tax=Amphiura filiformis TaxID=82378 RepID=UPI003B210BF9